MSISNTTPTAVLLQELQSLKSQEATLQQIVQKCSGCLNKLRVEELQLKAVLRQESDANVQQQQQERNQGQSTSKSATPAQPAASNDEFYFENAGLKYNSAVSSADEFVNLPPIDNQNFLDVNAPETNFTPFVSHRNDS